MKKSILLVLSFLLVVTGFGQYTQNQTMGTANTLVSVPANGGLRGALVNRTFADTTAANSHPIAAYPFAQIGTTGDGNMWVRNYLATGWVLLGGGTSPSGTFWRVGGNMFPVTAPTRDIGTDAFYGGAVGLMTSGIVRAIVPNGGFVLDNDTTSNKIFTWNPSTKGWGYANWNNGGGGTGGGGIGSFEDSVANVRDFGAVGDGVTEDSAAFKAALATGRDVYVPKGTYKITAINLSPVWGQTIFGDGENTKIITAQTNGAIFKVVNPNVKFMNLTFEGSGKTSSLPGQTVTTYQTGIWVQINSTTITNCTFRRFNGRGVYVFHPSATYILNNTVINNRFFQNTVGIESDYGADYLLVANNSLDTNYACIVEGGNANVYYLGNQATQSTFGYYSYGGATHGSIVGGSFNHNTTGLRIPSGQQGMTITDTKFWFSDIVLGSSDTVSRISFYNCVVEGSNVTLTRVKNSKWVGGYIYGSSPNVVTGTGMTFENVITAPAGLNEWYGKDAATDSSLNTKNGLSIGRGIYAPNLPTFTDTTSFKPLVINGSGTVYKATYWPGGGSGSTAISALTAASATNDINNADYGQIWRWNTLSSGVGLTLSTSSTASTDAGHTLLGIDMQGANANSSQTTYAASFANSHTGTSSTNIGLLLQAYSGTNNYALDLGVAGSNTGRMRLNGSTSGSIVIQPASAAGTYTLTLPTTDGASGEFLQTDGSGALTWAAASGGVTVGTTPVTSGTDTYVFFQDGSVVGQDAGFTYTKGSNRLNVDAIGTTGGLGYLTFDANGGGGNPDMMLDAGSATMMLYNTWNFGWGVPLSSGDDIAIKRNAAGILEINNGTPGTFADLKLREAIFSGRNKQSQGADVASAAGAIALGSDGNSFEITGTAAITLISNVNWQNGSEVTLLFTSTATLTDGTANSGTDIGMELAGNTNFTASAGATLTLILSEIGGTQRWREKCRSVN